jgi:hypothetical protein
MRTSWLRTGRGLTAADSHLISEPSHLSGWPDLNRRPPGPKPGALPSCATARCPARSYHSLHIGSTSTSGLNVVRSNKIRTRRLLLPNQLLAAARHRPTRLHVASTCEDSRSMPLEAAWLRCLLAPTLASMHISIEQLCAQCLY